MDTVIIDTNVIVRYLKTVDGILADIMGHYDLKVSAVTVTELLASKRAANQTANQQIRDFISKNFEVISVTDEIAAKAADIIRAENVALAHALVAATAIDKDVPLLTYEISTFDRIPDLQLVDV